ncbi:hypothetical protein TNCV_2916981 [Trichonephila clavipes]|nr:hypothetical protein TNCV_2916981 [Trichonephila clavipes]
MCELKALSSAYNTSPGPDGISYELLRHLNEDSLISFRIWREPNIQPNKEGAGVSYLMARSHSDCHSKTWNRSQEPSQLSTDSTHELPF